MAAHNIHSCTHAQYRATMHVVTRFNDGSAVSAEYLHNLMRRIASVYGAVNVSPEYIGFWQDPETGIEYTDPQKLFSVDVNSAQACHTFRELAATVRNELGQVCVYVTSQPISTYLV